MKVLRRRDEFLMIVSQSKKLRYPNRSIYSVLDSQAKHEVRFWLSAPILQHRYLWIIYSFCVVEEQCFILFYWFFPTLIQMEATGRSNFLTWLPDECWVSLHQNNLWWSPLTNQNVMTSVFFPFAQHHTTPPLPPEPSLKCSRDQYVKIAVGRSCSEAFPPLRKCFFTTQ